MANDDILDYSAEEGIVDPQLYTADGGARFANLILDRLVIYAILFGIGSLMEFADGGNDAIFGMFVLASPFYYILSEYFWGKTPAKFITKTSVVNLYGEKPTFINIVGRTLCRYIPFEAFSFLGSRAVGWHDSISRTRVVRDAYLYDHYV